MPPQSETFVHFIVALPAEAKPLIAHYRLKRRVGEDAFAVFEKEGISLTVSGIGKVATAAAIGYTHVLFGKRKNAVWLNVGVAGHREHPLGSVWIAHKISRAPLRERLDRPQDHRRRDRTPLVPEHLFSSPLSQRGNPDRFATGNRVRPRVSVRHGSRVSC